MPKKGWTKDTRVISVRVEATVYSRLESLAEKLAEKKERPVSVGDYLKFLIETQAMRRKPGQWKRRRIREGKGLL